MPRVGERPALQAATIISVRIIVASSRIPRTFVLYIPAVLAAIKIMAASGIGVRRIKIY